ncbi:HAD family phosphatase [Sutterella sp.]|uniref:HAD family hydrolase n=1 Tax=Sutterella sp. TaxID=1981025 RepID=UPI0026E036E6|nr:HAD family phosphatase [Sutterella sp.]MDO5531162.1 HAD family phosphatase [Sutterella sp.]
MFLDRRILIFDLDGTLIDSLGVWSQVDQELVRRLSNDRVHLTEDEAGELRVSAMRRHGEGSDAYLKYMVEMKRDFDLPGTPEEIHHQRYELAQEFLRTRVKYRPGAGEVIRTLKSLGKTLAIATTTRRRNIVTYATENEWLMAEAPLNENFELILTRDDVEHVKPDPEVFTKIMAHFGAKPEECLVIEDALPGIVGARAVGIDSVVISERYAEPMREQLDRAAVARFETHADLLAAIRSEAGR